MSLGGRSGGPTTGSAGSPTVISQSPSATGTVTSVADSATDQTLLAANAARLGVSIHNTSTEILFIRCEAAAATTSVFTARLVPNALWEPPAGVRYTGIIHGIWASDPNTGAALVTEYT